jgi:hypothetical protein
MGGPRARPPILCIWLDEPYPLNSCQFMLFRLEWNHER